MEGRDDLLCAICEDLRNDRLTKRDRGFACSQQAEPAAAAAAGLGRATAGKQASTIPCRSERRHRWYQLVSWYHGISAQAIPRFPNNQSINQENGEKTYLVTSLGWWMTCYSQQGLEWYLGKRATNSIIFLGGRKENKRWRHGRWLMRCLWGYSDTTGVRDWA